jgi:hypothetical protein
LHLQRQFPHQLLARYVLTQLSSSEEQPVNILHSVVQKSHHSGSGLDDSQSSNDDEEDDDNASGSPERNDFSSGEFKNGMGSSHTGAVTRKSLTDSNAFNRSAMRKLVKPKHGKGSEYSKGATTSKKKTKKVLELLLVG